MSCAALRVTMIFKIIAFVAAAIPIFLFVRSIFFRRTTRMNEGLREFKKQANLAVISVPHCVCCSLRSRQVGLDVVVITLNASAAFRGRNGAKDRLEAYADGSRRNA